MKKLFFPVLALLALSMASCSNENEPANGSDELVEVKLNASVFNVATKAIVNKGDAFDAQVFKSETTGTYSDAGQGVTFATDGTTTLTSAWYYPVDADKSLYLMGYSPKTGTGIVNTSGTVTFTIDGDMDVMVAAEVSGNRDTQVGEMAFAHQLSQIQFEVAKSANVTETDMTITSITVKDVSPEVKLVMPATVTYEGTAKDLTVKGTSPSAALTATAVECGYIMVPPAATYTVDIVTNKGTFSDVTINPSTGEFVKASAHVITLTFDAQEASVTGSVGEWINGTDGGSTIK